MRASEAKQIVKVIIQSFSRHVVADAIQLALPVEQKAEIHFLEILLAFPVQAFKAIQQCARGRRGGL